MGRTLHRIRQLVLLFIAAVMVAGGSGVLLPAYKASAADLESRSLRIEDPTAGEATPHTFRFTYPTTDTIGSVVFEYCTSPLLALPCDIPPGMDASGAALAGQTGVANYVQSVTQPGRIVLTRIPSTVNSGTAASYVFNNVINPTGAPDTFYARISTYTSIDGSGQAIDFGAVVNSTTQGVGISSEVPPILNFCVGVAIPGDCSTADGSVIDLGDLTPSVTSSGTSQMMVGTNADFGVSIAAYGSTMTSGNNIIRALTDPTLSAPGNAQFGLNLRSNSNPDVGENPSGGGIVVPTARYNTPNQFAFVSGDIVASSLDATRIRKFTASYIVNVPPSQQPGVYSATVTYICTASF
jgi:hypothetical protein